MSREYRRSSNPSKPFYIVWRDMGFAVKVHDRQGDRIDQRTASRLRKLYSGADEGKTQCIAQQTQIV